MTLEQELEWLKNDRDKIFSSLQCAKKHNKQLMVEIGVLQSELSEVKDKLDKKDKLTPEDKYSIKRGEFYLGQKNEIIKLKETVGKLRKDNQDLIIKLINKDKELC